MLIRNDYCYKARDLLRRILIPYIVTISSYIANELMDQIENQKLFVVAATAKHFCLENILQY